MFSGSGKEFHKKLHGSQLSDTSYNTDTSYNNNNINSNNNSTVIFVSYL